MSELMSEPDLIPENQPYRPDSLIERVKVPEEIRTPETEEEFVNAAKYTYQGAKDSPQKLPPEYRELEDFFHQQYERGYSERRGIDIIPNNLDLLFQQYAIKMDETSGKNGFNTVGMAALSYMDGLATADKAERYLGAQEDIHRRKEYRALLLGCSSMSSATEFTALVHALNPQAMALVADLDPLAVKLAGETGANVVQADVQRIPLEDNSIDFVATNFLVPNLIDKFGSGKETVEQVLKEVARVLTSKGRLIMVEQLTRNNLEWLTHYAFNAGLALDAKGVNNKAIILANRDGLEEALERIPKFTQSEGANTNKLISAEYGYKEFPGITALVFKEPQWSHKKGWKVVEKVVVKGGD